jgi:predicted RND superfamily exporter protein
VEDKKLRNILKWCFIVCLTLTHVFLFQFTRLDFDYDFEKFFPQNDPETAYFEEFREKFESDNDFMLVALKNEDGAFQPGFLKDVKELTISIDSLELIQHTLSLTNTNETTARGAFHVEQPYFSGPDSLLQKDSIRIFSHDELIQSFISKDAKSVCIFLRHQDYLSKNKCDTLVNQINELIEGYNFDEIHLTGRAPGQAYYVDKMQYEMIFFVGLSMILIVIFLAFTYKSFWGVWIPLVIVLGSMIWVVGCIALFGESINLTMIVLPSIMFVVGTSDVIHLVSKYLEHLRNGVPKNQSIINAYKEVGVATLLTSVTTAIGFLSLMVINIEPIQVFGKYSALGVMLAFILTYTLLPALLYMTKPPKKLIEQKQTDTFWTKWLQKMFPVVLKRPKLIGATFIILLTIAGFGIYQLESNNYLLDDLDDSTIVKQDFNFLDANFGGVRPFEMGVVLKDTVNYSIHDEEVMNEIQKVETYLQEVYGVENLISVNQTMLMAHRSFTGNIDTNIQHITKNKRNKYVRMFKKKGGQIYARFVHNNTTRISGQLEDLGNIVITERNEHLYQFLEDSINTELLEFKPTGTAHLIDQNMSYMAENLMLGLLIALAIVAIIMGFLYKSARMVLLAVIPNVLPLVFVAGFMGFTDIDLKFSTAVIFTIAFGIAVDDTIHFMSKFKIELRKGKSKLYALKRTFLSTGRAIILTSLILIGGFLLLIFSDFNGTYFIGIMISLSLIFAVFADLFLLPVLLIWFYKKK